MPIPKFSHEDDFQRAVEELADMHGWETRHISRRSYQVAADANAHIPAGFPDLELRYYAAGQDKPIIIFAELKMYNPALKNLTDAQEQYIKGFAHIVPCFLWRPQDWEWIEEILTNNPPEPTGEIIEASTASVIQRSPLIPDRSTRAIVRKIVNEIKGFAPGDLAGLKRMNPDSPDTNAFWQIMAKRGLLQNPSNETKWALILHGIALMTPNAHNGSVPVGRALFLGGDNVRQAENGFYSRSRLNKLLNARGTTQRALLARMFRMLSQAGQPFNWYEMAEFILNEDDKEAAEQSRLRIARDYYGTETR